MKEMLSPQELADYLGVPLQTVYEWNSSGKGPHYSRFGRHVRYAASDVEEWRKAHRVDRTGRVDRAEARQTVDKIIRHMSATQDLMEKIHRERVWEVLGYATWDAFCEAEFIFGFDLSK